MNNHPKVSRADLHVHSKHSNRPSEWFLRRIGAPESYMEPADVYDACKAAGMDYVTISDHNCIDGALEIAHMPGTFISSELTTYFPENGCKIHCLVTGISGNQFRDMQTLRENIYDLHAYLQGNNIIHAIAHPLFSVNDKLTIELFEKMILLFRRFEGINGSRDPRACDIATLVLRNLTPGIIDDLSARHEMIPVGSEPWKKTFIGGSDDHAGLHIAGAYTVTPYAPDIAGFLGFLHEGRHRPEGAGGTSIRLAHSLYRIAYGYYRQRFLTPGTSDRSIVGTMLKRLSGHPGSENLAAQSGFGFRIRSKVKSMYMRGKLNEIEKLILDEFSRVLGNTRHTKESDSSEADGDTAFQAACRLSQELSFAFIKRASAEMQAGGLMGSIQAISALGPVALGIAPYLTAFSAQHKDESFLRDVARHFPAASCMTGKSGKKAWITDTFNDVNGVTKTIRTLAGMAAGHGKNITVVTSLDEEPVATFPIRNFRPVGSFRIPEYESLLVGYPPFLEILAYFEKEKFDEIILSTPGTLGLCALGAAKLLAIPVTGIYHTDFPRFFADITEDASLGEAALRFMRWFYGQCDRILVPTRTYRRILVDGGFDGERIDIMPRGIDGERFSPALRTPGLWKGFGLADDFKILYVGRISKEKNMETLLRAFLRAIGNGLVADLILVGEGPIRGELQAHYSHPRIVFTGARFDEELARIYASADLFAFPSMTDTFGNAVLEAHASGLPALVSDEGGPREIVESHGSGLVVDARTPEAMSRAMLRLATDSTMYAQLRENAVRKAKESRWEDALDKL